MRHGAQTPHLRTVGADSRVVTEYRLVGAYHDRTVSIGQCPRYNRNPRHVRASPARSRPCRGAINGCRDGLGGGSSKRAATRVRRSSYGK